MVTETPAEINIFREHRRIDFQIIFYNLIYIVFYDVFNNYLNLFFKTNMTSCKSEGVIANFKHTTEKVRDIVKERMKFAKNKVQPDMFYGKFMDVSEEYIRRMFRCFKQLKYDIYNFLSKFSYRFNIDCDFLFHLCFGMYRMICYDNLPDLFMTLIFTIRTFMGKKIYDYIDLICDWCNNFILDLKSFGKVKSEAVPEFTPDFSFRRWFDTLVDSNLAKSLRMLILNLVGLKFFKRGTAKKFTALLGPAQPVSLVEFCRNSLTTIEEFITFGVNYSNSKSFVQALMKDDPVVAFLESTYNITLRVRNVYLGDDSNFKKLEEERANRQENAIVETESSKIAAKDFIVEVRKAILNGESILKRCTVNAAFKARLYLLKEIYDSLIVKMRSKNRRAPFGLIIHGDPSIGKSSILVHVYKLWAKYKNLEYSSDLVYDRNPKSDYWTNHDPLSQPIIHYPELGSIASNIVKNQGDQTIDEMLMVADTQPYSAEMADVNEKGKCMLMPELLVIDCNDPAMNLDYTNNNPAAIRRRFTYVEVKVKSEYANLTALDETKIPEDLEHKMDLWSFKVYKQTPNGIKYSEEFPISNGRTDIFGFSKILMELFEEHDHKQDGFGKAVAEDIDKYLVTSEGMPAKAISYVWNSICAVFAWFFPFIAAFLAISYWWYSIVNQYNSQCLSFSSFFKIKMLTIISYYFVEYKMYMWLTDARISTEVYFMTGVYFLKSYWDNDPKYYEYKLRFNNLSLVKKFNISLIFFSISIAFMKIVLSFMEITSQVTSEGNVIQSSGKFIEEKVDDNIIEIEEKSQSELPLPKKKLNSDKDYDNIQSIIPRYIGDTRCSNNPQEIYNMIFGNIRYLIIDSDIGPIHCMGVGLCEDIILMNKHCLSVDGAKMQSSHNKVVQIAKSIHKINMSKIIIVGEDAVVFRWHGQQFKDITFLFTDIYESGLSMKAIYNRKKIRVTYTDKYMFVKNTLQNYNLNKYFTFKKSDHENGDCGMPLLVTCGNKSYFAGIHSAGHDKNDECYATIINKTNIVKAIDDLQKDYITHVVSEGQLRLPVGSSINDVTSRSPLLYEDVPGLGVIGSLKNYSMISPKSRLVESPIINEIEYLVEESPYRSDGNLKYLPPMMKSTIINNKYIAPYNQWIKKVGVVKETLNHDVMTIVSVSLSSYLLIQLKNVGINTLRPTTLMVAQNGFPDNFYIRAMKNNTSGGFLLPGKKSAYNKPVELPFKKDAVEPNFDVKEQVLEILDAYVRNESSHDIIGAQLKDEPRSFDKARAGKTRVFAMSSYPMTLVNRMYLMPFYSLMCEHREIFGTRVGINMHSSEASRMYNSLINFSNNIMEGDYGGYDTSMPVGVGLMANSVVYQVLQHLGYNDYALNIVRGILSDNLYPTISMEGNLIVAPGFQPSGKYATAEDNSLRGLILLYYAYVVMCTNVGIGDQHNLTIKFKVCDFFKYIKPETYGDDMLCAVKDEIAEYFNNITYSIFVREVYGMEFTTADKHEHKSKFVDPVKISFLKRSFVYNKMLERIVATLDRDSFVKSLTYILPSKEVDQDTQIVETCGSVLRELFFYYEDLVEYDLKRQQFIDILLKYVEYTRDDLEKCYPKGIELKREYM